MRYLKTFTFVIFLFSEKRTNHKMFKFDMCILKTPFCLTLTCRFDALYVILSSMFCTDYPEFRNIVSGLSVYFGFYIPYRI